MLIVEGSDTTITNRLRPAFALAASACVWSIALVALVRTLRSRTTRTSCVCVCVAQRSLIDCATLHCEETAYNKLNEVGAEEFLFLQVFVAR